MWVAQSVECPTLGFASGHDLTVVDSSPAWDSLSPSPSALPQLALALSLSLSQTITVKTTTKLSGGSGDIKSMPLAEQVINKEHSNIY